MESPVHIDLGSCVVLQAFGMFEIHYPGNCFQSWMQDSSNVCNWDEFQNVARQQTCDAHEAAGFRETSDISH